MRWSILLLLWGAARAEELEIATQNKMGQMLDLKELTYTVDGNRALHLTGADAQLNQDIVGKLQQQPSPGMHKVSAQLAFQGKRIGVFSYLAGYTFKIDVDVDVKVEPSHKTLVTLVAFLKPGSSMDFEKRPTAGFYVSYDPPIAVLPPPPERPDMATAPPPPDLGEAPPTPVTPTATPNEPEAKTPKLSKAARAKLAREERLAKAKAEKQARAERLAQAKADQLAKAEAEKQARAERLAQAKAEKQGKAETPPPEETPPEEAPKLSKAARAKLAREERLAKAKAEKQAREERLAQAKADRLAKAEAEKQAKAEKPAAPEKPEKVAKAEPEEAPPLVAPPKSQRAAQQRVRTELFNPSGITSHVVHFDFDAEQPRARFLAVLDGIARSLVEHPEIHRLRIEGHTDSIGDETYNQGLSERRARWVADYLVRKSVAAERVHSVGFGESRPRANGSDSAARAQNRRIEFVIEE